MAGPTIAHAGALAAKSPAPQASAQRPHETHGGHTNRVIAYASVPVRNGLVPQQPRDACGISPIFLESGASLGILHRRNAKSVCSEAPMTIHVTTNEDIRKAVRRGLRLPVRFMRDNVLEGPCASEPEDHCERRCDYWNLRGRERTQFRSRFNNVINALTSRQRIVVWTSGLWSDRLMLWALCAWRLRYWPEHPVHRLAQS